MFKFNYALYILSIFGLYAFILTGQFDGQQEMVVSPLSSPVWIPVN